jgi:hypothetical protein
MVAWTYNLRVMGFKDFSHTLGRLSATVNAIISAQNCPKLPKCAQMCPNLLKDKTLKFHQKSRF